MQLLVSKKVPDSTIFIIDGLSAAFIVALICKGRSIRCIYECKKIQWRNVDFVALYDLLLADVNVLEKRIEYVPHPYFIDGGNIFETIWNQMRFIRGIRYHVPLDQNEIYCGCVTSSILLGNKDIVSHILMDEGMDSIMTRHRLYRQGRSIFMDRIREIIAGLIIPFRFNRDTPQITIATDEHSTICLRRDYRDFRSHLFTQLAAPLLKNLDRSDQNVLVLVNGPPHLSESRISDQNSDFAPYVKFNLLAIKRFLTLQSSLSDACFYLKTHPSLGADSPLLDTLLASLESHSISARRIWDGIDFEEVSSIPAEACLASGKFNVLLSLDASSTLWNVGHDPSLSCFMPLDDIIHFASECGFPSLFPLLAAQRELNHISGNHVILY